MGKMRTEKYRKLDAIYLDDKCIIKMSFEKYAKEIVRRWNVFEENHSVNLIAAAPNLLEALKRAYFLLQTNNIKDEYFEVLRIKLGNLLPNQVVEIKEMIAAITKAEKGSVK